MVGNKKWQAADTEKVKVKRGVVLDTAISLFNTQGIEKTSLNDVSNSLGISKSALYYYVSGKEDLIFQCYLQAVEQSAEYFANADQNGQTGLEKIEIYLRADIGNQWGSTTALTELHLLSDDHRKIIKTKGHENEETFRRFVREGIEDGSIDAKSTKLVEFAIMGAFCWLPRWYSPDGESSLEEIADAFMHIFFNGLKPRT